MLLIWKNFYVSYQGKPYCCVRMEHAGSAWTLTVLHPCLLLRVTELHAGLLFRSPEPGPVSRPALLPSLWPHQPLTLQ